MCCTGSEKCSVSEVTFDAKRKIARSKHPAGVRTIRSLACAGLRPRVRHVVRLEAHIAPERFLGAPEWFLTELYSRQKGVFANTSSTNRLGNVRNASLESRGAMTHE